MTIRVMLPAHLRTIAKVTGEVELEVPAPATIAAVIDALEAMLPALGGTVRDHGTQVRRPFIRYFACAEDWSHHPPEAELPAAVQQGREPLMILGAIAGG